MSRNPEAPSPVVEFEGASLSGGAGLFLNDISFGLAPGSAHFLTGAPGAGKTALMDRIGAARAPDRGRLSLFGHDVADLSAGDRAGARRRIGRVFQDLRLLDHLSVFDNAALMPRIAGRKAADYGAEVVEVLVWVGLGARMDSPAGDLEQAGRRRLAIARAAAGRPDILLADEPAGDLEPKARAAILRLLAQLNQAGTALLIATRDETTAARSGAPSLHLKGGGLIRYEAAAREPEG